jgi:5-methylthioadenosine/S-adenosylhomocysteine deaminase
LKPLEIRAFEPLSKSADGSWAKIFEGISSLEEVFELLDQWHGREKGRLQVTLCPRFALSCSEDLLKEVGKLSRELHLIHHTHASENKKECDWIQKHFGLSNIGLLHQMNCLNEHTVIAHGVHLSSRDLQILKKSKASISHCPVSNLKLASGIADIKRLANLNLSLGVDGAACNNLLDPFFEMRMAHLLSRSIHGLNGVSAQSILKWPHRRRARSSRRPSNRKSRSRKNR